MTGPTGFGLLAACSNLKASPPPNNLQVRSLPTGAVTTRLRTWVDRLSVADRTRATPAQNLYSGVYWSEVRRAWDQLKEHDHCAPLWVISAGYGLLSADAHVSPYAATFSPGEADSVTRSSGVPREGSAQWWRELARWAGPTPGLPRTLPQLLAYLPDRLWIVVAGPHYIHALMPDLEEIARNGAHERLVIVSVGLKPPAVPMALRSLVIPADARWENVLGKGRGNLSIRVARKLLAVSNFQPEQLSRARALLAEQARDLPPISTHHRTRATDDDVRAFIRESLNRDPTMSFARLLRAFRDSHRACEYTRFRALLSGLLAKDSPRAK